MPFGYCLFILQRVQDERTMPFRCGRLSFNPLRMSGFMPFGCGLFILQPVPDERIYALRLRSVYPSTRSG